MRKHRNIRLLLFLSLLLPVCVLCAGCSSAETDNLEQMIFKGSATGGGNPARVVFTFALAPQDAAFEGSSIAINSLTIQGDGTFGALTYATTDMAPVEVVLSVEHPTQVAINPPQDVAFDSLIFANREGDATGIELNLVYRDPVTGSAISRSVTFPRGLAFDLAAGTTPWSGESATYLVYLPFSLLDMTAGTVDLDCLTDEAVLYNDTDADGSLDAEEIAEGNAAGTAAKRDCQTDDSCQSVILSLPQQDICPQWDSQWTAWGFAECQVDQDCGMGSQCDDGFCRYPDATIVECQTDAGICRLSEAVTGSGIASNLMCMCPGDNGGGRGSFLADESVFDQPLTQAYCEKLTVKTCNELPVQRSCDLEAVCSDAGLAQCQALFGHLTSCYKGVADPTDYLMAVCCEGVNLYGETLFADMNACMETEACGTWNGLCYTAEVSCDVTSGQPVSYLRLQMLLLGIMEPFFPPQGPYPNGETVLRACDIIE